MTDELMDDPNRQAVGLDPIWTGAGDPGATPKAATQSAEESDADSDTGNLEDMSKRQLLDRAASLGLDVHETWNKAEIREAIVEAGG